MSEYNIIDLYKLKTESKGFHERHIIRGAIEEIQTLRTKLERHARQAPASWEGRRVDWVDCPVCGEPDMQKTEHERGATLIHCCNHNCVSNGGTNSNGLTHPPAKVPEAMTAQDFYESDDFLLSGDLHACEQQAEGWNKCRRAMLTAAPTAPAVQGGGVPEGWKLVPVEPTEEMRDAARIAYKHGYSSVYREMLESAPQPPKEGE